MRKFITKKSLGFIASLMIMTVAFAVPVLADEPNINVPITYNGNEVGNLQFRPGFHAPFVVKDRNNNSHILNLGVSNITSATLSFLPGCATIRISGTFSGFDETEAENWKDYADSNGDILPGSPADISSLNMEGMITRLEGTELPSSYIGQMLPFKLGASAFKVCNVTTDNSDPDHPVTTKTPIAVSSVPLTGFLSINYGPKPSKKSEEKKEEKQEEEAPQPKKSEWRPAPEAAKTPAQTAAAQLTTAQTNLAALSVIPAASKEVFKSSGMPLNMTSVNTVDSNTTKLITANADIPYNVTFNFMGKPMVCTIPAGFNYAQFTKADGTMNIHEVLWSVYTGSWKKTNTRARTTRGRR